MHIRHLRGLATKILDSQDMDTNLKNYYIRQVQDLCKSVFRDCCIELEVSADNVERAASSTNHAQYLIQSIENHFPLPQEIKKKFQEVCSLLEESTINSFLIIVPYLIQNIKDIFVDERLTEGPQNGLRGLSKETREEFVSSIRTAKENKTFFDLLCYSSIILEKLCLENYSEVPSTEIRNWGERMDIFSMLNHLKRFFQHSSQDVRLHKRLDLLSGGLRETIAHRHFINEAYVHDLADVLMSLLQFVKIDHSKVVRFELNGSTDPCLCPRESVRYDELENAYSQVFRIKKETEDELRLHATARVYIDGQIYGKGAFQSTIMLSPSSEKALNGFISTRFHDVTVTKLEDKGLFFLCSAQKEKLLELLEVLRRELGENLQDMNSSKVSWCPLSVRNVSKIDTILSLRLVYKWGSESVVLDSKDFVMYARSSLAQCEGKYG